MEKTPVCVCSYARVHVNMHVRVRALWQIWVPLPHTPEPACGCLLLALMVCWLSGVPGCVLPVFGYGLVVRVPGWECVTDGNVYI